ncbi:MAG: response regulator [Planctomycetota bacterium]|nr:response regulator [Planctomycetota bacterium]
MTTILVVDDSMIDRRLVGGILTSQANYEVRYAADGSKALDDMQAFTPDAVVTDLIMPEMDGLELVREIRDRYAEVPVVLMTSQGNERIAVGALECGAASYVPKRQLTDELVETMRHVLAMSSRQRSHERLMSGLNRNQATFVLPNDSMLIASLVSYLQDHVAQMGVCDEAERIRFGVALEEALVNAMYHGNLEVESNLKENDQEAYDALVRQRREQSPFAERRIYVETDISRAEAVVVVGDDGPGFDPASLADPTDVENLDRVSGRGVLLMRTFMDTVEFNREGNRVTMKKRRTANENGGT